MASPRRRSRRRAGGNLTHAHRTHPYADVGRHTSQWSPLVSAWVEMAKLQVWMRWTEVGSKVDPVSVVVAAMSAGAVSRLGSGASKAIDDAFKGLKSRVFRKDSESSVGALLADEYENDPETWQAALRRYVEREGAQRDPEVLELAVDLLYLVDERGSEQGRYNVTRRGSQAVQIGDNNVQNNTFQ